MSHVAHIRSKVPQSKMSTIRQADATIPIELPSRLDPAHREAQSKYVRSIIRAALWENES